MTGEYPDLIFPTIVPSLFIGFIKYF